MVRPNQDVDVFTIQDRRGDTKRARPWLVRWRVEGKHRTRSFRTRVEADRFRSHLIRAATEGEPFDSRSGEPTRWGCETEDLAARVGAAVGGRAVARVAAAHAPIRDGGAHSVPSAGRAGGGPEAARHHSGGPGRVARPHARGGRSGDGAVARAAWVAAHRPPSGRRCSSCQARNRGSRSAESSTPPDHVELAGPTIERSHHQDLDDSVSSSRGSCLRASPRPRTGTRHRREAARATEGSAR